MAKETAKASIYLDGKQAEAALDSMSRRAKDLKKDFDAAQKAGDQIKMNKLEKQIRDVESAQRSLRKESFDTQKVLQNLNGSSFNDLTKALKTSQRELKRMGETDAGYKDKLRDVVTLKTRVKELSDQQRLNMNLWDRLKDSARGLLPAFGFAGILIGLKRMVSTADSLFTRFQERVDNLSALTGLEGDQLDWLSEKAKETSTATIEGNIHIKQSAEAIVDAYTKVGSKRPELLKVKEDLASVTQEAIILSEAAKSELEPAVAGLTMALNQFDMKADQSRRIINVLAAGSMVGAGEIPYLTDAMEKSGTTANLMKIPLEQWAGAVEAIAPYYERAEVAGTSFDRVLLKMKEKQIGYVNGVFDMNTALDQLEKMYASGTSSADIFGTEHSKMGELLVKERDKMNEFTKAVTGTNVAIEQAAKNTNNEAAKRAQAQNEINKLYLEFGEKIAPLLTKGITSGVELLNVAVKYRAILIPLTVAIAGYAAMAKLKVFWDTTQKGATILAAAAQALFTGNITRATAAMRLFNTVTKLNPYILLASLIAAAGVALFAYSNRVKEVAASQKALIDVETRAQQSIVEEKLKVEQLLKVAKDEKISKEERLKAIKELNEISPEYLGNLTLEKINSDEAKKSTDEYILSLLQKAKVQAAQEMIVELEKKHIEAVNSGTDSQVKWYQTLKNSVLSYGNAALFVGRQTMSSVENLTEAEKEYLEVRKSLSDIVEKGRPTIVNPAGGNPPNPANPNSPASDPAAAKAATDALDAAHASEILRIKQYYADKEQLDKESKARLLAAELAYLQAKAQLEPDQVKKLELQSQIIDKQKEYTAALKEATPELMLNREGINNLSKSLLEEAKLLALAAKKQNEASDASEESKLKTEKQRDMILSSADALGQALYDLASGGEDAMKNAAKTMINFALDMLKIQVEIAIAKATIESLTQPDSVATFGVTGFIRAAVMVGLIEAAFAGVKGLVNGFSEGGPTGGSDKRKVVGVVHGEEYVIPEEGYNNPGIRPIVDLMEIARRNGSLARLDLRPVVASIGSGKKGFASGGPSGSSSTASTSPVDVSGASRDPELTAALNNMSRAVAVLVKNGVQFPIYTFKKRYEEISDLLDQPGMGGFEK